MTNKKTLLQTPNHNLNAATRGNRRSKEEQIRILDDIFQLSWRHNDSEIMKILRLGNSTYYRYKKKMHKEAEKAFIQEFQGSLAYRGLHLANSIYLGIKIAEEIAKDPEQKAADRLEAANFLVESEIKFTDVLWKFKDQYNQAQEHLPQQQQKEIHWVTKCQKCLEEVWANYGASENA